MITLKDLAKKLNVSTSTVSKALNNSHEISQETKNKVKQAAEQYNYIPNRVAQNLKSQNTKTIGVIIPSILNRFFATVLLGIETEAAKNGYQIITCLSNESIHKEKKSLTLLGNGSVDGIILAVSQETQVKGDFSHIQTIQKKKIPVLLFDRDVVGVNCDRVIINDYKAIQIAIQDLIEKGKENIAFVSTIHKLNVGRLRCKGYQDGMINSGKIIKKNWILNLESGKSIQDSIRYFLTLNPEIDAVISADNMSGSIVVNVAKDMGLKIPESLSVVGFSDKSISEMSVPKLAYLDQKAELIGETALSLMIERLNKKNHEIEPVTISINVELITQESL